MKKITKKVTKKATKVRVLVNNATITMTSPKPLISILSVSFGQEDMNKMVDKINEIIMNFNGVV